MSNGYKPIYDLIIESCKVQPDFKTVTDLIDSIADWDKLVEASYMHGVLPVVYKTLKQFADHIPADVLSAFKAYNLQIARTNMQMTSELLRVVKLLNEHHIRYMALKGPVLSQIIHGDTVQRQYTDLDILVEKEDIYQVAELLYGHGYTSEHEIKFLKNKALLKIGKDFTFRQVQTNIYLEVHWNLFLDRFIKTSNMNLFTPNLLKSSVNGYNIQTLEIEYLLVYLCLHGSQHFWERIGWVVDIDRLIRLNPKMDWESVQKIAKEIQNEAKFYLGLAVVHEMFNLEFPAGIQEKIAKMENAKEQVFKLQFSNATETMQTLYRKRIIRHTKTLVTDNVFTAVRNYFHLLLRIKEEDVYMINLPNSLSILYYLVRPFHLITKKLTRSGKIHES